uniref:Eukaryotic translation initiation factor 3 subunit C N-terminal domain-containing protein n=1 Tax=Timema monikensis TaxID=170555 RepID=A0A7R9E647_9NEOP|nr:unnamed protein product [Timema monikensis]
MSKNNSKSLTSIRQKLRKYTKEFEEDMAKFRANPDQPDEEEEERAEKGTRFITESHVTHDFRISNINPKTPWCILVIEPNRPSGRRLLAKVVPTSSNRGCHVVLTTYVPAMMPGS